MQNRRTKKIGAKIAVIDVCQKVIDQALLSCDGKFISHSISSKKSAIDGLLLVVYL